MINLHQVLSTIYADKNSGQIYDLLEQYSFIGPLKKTVTQLNTIIANQKVLMQSLKSLPVGHIASNLLLAVNQRIDKEKAPEIVGELENIISDICIGLLKEFFKFIQSDRKAIIAHIDFALKDTCDFHSYDYNQLVRLLKLESFISYLQSLKNADKIISYQIPSYCWKGKLIEKEEFLDIFTSQRLIKSKKGLHLLFENPIQTLELSFDPALANLTLQFFYTLKKKKLLSQTVVGFYQVLEFHVQGFKKDFLKNQEAGDRINAMRQNKTQWAGNEDRIEKWLSSFWVPGTLVPTGSST